MVFFLRSIAVVLIVIGGAAAFYGAETVRLESGITLALAGVWVTCSGFLLLGIAQVCAELRAWRAAAEEGGPSAMAGAFRPAFPPLPPTPPDMTGPVAEPVSASFSEQVSGRIEPVLAAGASASARPEPAEAAGPKPGEATIPVGASARGAREEPAKSEANRTSAPPGPGTPGLAEKEGAAEKADEAAKAAPRTAIATYNSGGNTYFMYSDGTIEAETPRGRYLFKSMEELRHYAETGEGGTPVTKPEEAEPA